MSTRCQIGFYPTKDTPLNQWEALVYRHSDGYPDTKVGVLADILPTLKEFHAIRGLDDCEYAAAVVIGELKRRQWEWVRQYRGIDGKGLDRQWAMIGHGVSKKFHVDIEYLYAVSPECVRVFRASCSDWQNGNVEFKEIKKHRRNFAKRGA